MPTIAERAERLLATLERRWEELLGSYDGLPEEALNEPGVVGDGRSRT